MTALTVVTAVHSTTMSSLGAFLLTLNILAVALLLTLLSMLPVNLNLLN